MEGEPLASINNLLIFLFEQVLLGLMVDELDTELAFVKQMISVAETMKSIVVVISCFT